MVIYLTTNLINGKKYIGMDSRNNPKYLGGGSLIKKAIKKYGRINFKKEILETCLTNKELELRETYWINFHNALLDSNFYNLEDNRKRSISPFANKSQEEKNSIFSKISSSSKGKSRNKGPKPEGFKEAQAQLFKNRGPRSEESRTKQSNSLKGRQYPNRKKGYKISSDSINLKPISQYHIDGTFIRNWDSIRDAARDLGINRRSINNNLSNITSKGAGFKWKYVR